MSGCICEVPVLVLGATLAGLGIAAALGERAMVIERTSLIGREFIDSYNPGDRWESVQLSDEGRQIRQELVSRNILSGKGRVHIPAVAPVLFAYVSKKNLNVLFMTDIAGIQPADDGFNVTLFNSSGFQTIKTERIIDTTSACLSDPDAGKEAMLYKGIGTVLHPADEDAGFPIVDDKRATLVRGRYGSEVILQLALDPDDGWIKARHKLHQFWKMRQGDLMAWNLAAVASTMIIRTAPGLRPLTKGWTFLPSCGYPNPLEAFEQGGKWAIEEADAACC